MDQTRASQTTRNQNINQVQSNQITRQNMDQAQASQLTRNQNMNQTKGAGRENLKIDHHSVIYHRLHQKKITSN